MILYGAVILVLLLKKNEAFGKYQTTEMPSSHSEQESNRLDRRQLAKLIHHVNKGYYDDNNEDSVENFDIEDKNIEQLSNGIPQGIDLDYLGIRLSDGIKAPPRILKLIKKNYYANKAHAEDPDNDEKAVRVHLIGNPQVLEEYKKNLEKSQPSVPSDVSYEFEQQLERLRRNNAAYRPNSSNHRDFEKLALRKYENKKPHHYKHSRENDNRNHYKSRHSDVKEENEMVISDKRNNDYNDKTSFNKHSQSMSNHNKKLTKKDEWNIITKYTDSWKDKSSDYYKKKENNNNEEKNGKYNDNYKKDDYKNSDKYKRGDYKIKDGDRNKNKNFYLNQKNNENSKNRYRIKYSYNNEYKNKDNYKDIDKHNNNKNRDNYNDSDKRHDNYKKKNSREKRWDDEIPSHKPKVQNKNDGWGIKSHWDKHKPASNNDWVKWQSKSMEKTDTYKNRDISDDWDKEKNSDKSTRGNFEVGNKNYKDNRIKTTKDWKDTGGRGDNFKNKPSNLKTFDNNNARAKSRNNGVAKGFGRTSIPFIGKVGIYEDK